MAKKVEKAKEVKKKEVEKEKTMDLLDLANGARAIIKVKGEVEFTKLVIWDNADGQRGVIKRSLIFVVVRDENGKEKKFPIGNSEKNLRNLWVGVEIKKRTEKADTQEIAL